MKKIIIILKVILILILFYLFHIVIINMLFIHLTFLYTVSNINEGNNSKYEPNTVYKEFYPRTFVSDTDIV